jgi:peroxisomal 2,4-dienoyl-CoA reductase
VVRNVKRPLFLHLTDHPSLRLVLQAKTDIASTGTGGRIVFVSATYFQTNLPLQTHMVVAKSAVNALSNNLAIEMGPLGVTSNVIGPGPIGATEGMDRLAPASDADKDKSSRIPLGKQGSVKDIADATV